MGQKLVVGPINQGLRNDVTAFNIDQDAFPVLINAYQWRSRVKRKRGTRLFGRLQRYFDSTDVSYFPAGGTVPYTISLNSSGIGNLLGPYSSSDMSPLTFNLEAGANIVPGTVVITDTTTSDVYTDPAKDGTLSPSGSINYASGEIIITAAASTTATVQMIYNPALPVLGLEDFYPYDFPTSIIAFDTTYAYNCTTAIMPAIYDVSWYKNPPSASPYIAKTSPTPVRWNGQNYQQFWTVNYQNALWVTNGITSPFSISNIGMQFKPIVAVTVTTGGPPAVVNLEITGHGLVVGDFLFINEVVTTTGINYQTGYVTAVVDANNVTVQFPEAVIATNGTGGIAQYLTNSSDNTKDCLRWYDGDPTNGSVTSPVLSGNNGWVNFMPPLSNSVYSINDLPAAQYYLVGAKLIQNFKDRILFFGPVVQSSDGSPIYLHDTVVYSQNGTPYYYCTFDGSTEGAQLLTTTPFFRSLICPINQSATPNAYFGDVAGYGGWISSGLDQTIFTTAPNLDVIITGFSNAETQLVYTGNDLVPFVFYIVNSELGSNSTFSVIDMDQAVLSKGNRGFIATNQSGSQRIDLLIPDQIFEVDLLNHGGERVCAARDYQNEWIYWSYPSNQFGNVFPTQSVQYNYRDKSWALFNECYTTYGQYRATTGWTWATIGQLYPTWSVWNVPWNAGETNALQPQVIGGNQEGFIMVRGVGTDEAYSLYLSNISYPASITGVTQATSAVVTVTGAQFIVGQKIIITGVVGMTELNNNTYTIIAVTPTTVTLDVDSSAFTSYVSGGTATPYEPFYVINHCLNNGDYITFIGVLGTAGPYLNGIPYKITTSPQNLNGFDINNPDLEVNLPSGSSYLGGGTIKRYYVPFIQSKQFPLAWSEGRQLRIGTQQYLLSKTPNAQITLYIYLSQDADNPYNAGGIVPSATAENNSLIYSTTLYTSPENYIQVCTKISLGLIGNGSSTTYTLDYIQLFKLTNAPLVPGSVFVSVGTLATFTDNGTGGFTVTGTGNATGSSVIYATGIITLVFTSAPSATASYTNFSYYVPNIQSPTALYQQQIWHRVNTSLIGDTVQVAFTMTGENKGDQMFDLTLQNQTAEIELHSMIFDLSQSGLLA